MEATGSGCAWIDYNNDGLLDLYVVSGRYIDGVTKFSKPEGVEATNHLYRNNRRRDLYGRHRGKPAWVAKGSAWA